MARIGVGGKVVVDAPVIGIDLGNTNSRVAVWHENKVEIISNDVKENRLTPSWVAFTGAGEVLVGEAAKKQQLTNPENTIFDLKRMIGRRYDDKVLQKDMNHWPFKVVKGNKDEARISFNNEGKGEEKTVAVDEILALLIRNMKDSAEAFLEKEVSNAVITVPACFNDSQRRATKEACQIAGLNVVRIINDTTAAALAYAHKRQLHLDKKKKKVLFFDLGSASVDVSIVEIAGHHLNVKAAAGDTQLGGEYFNHRMVEYLAKELFQKEGGGKSRMSLQMEWENAKISLSRAIKSKIEVDSHHYEVTRTEFENLSQTLFLKCLEPIENCLKMAGIRRKEDIDDVVFLGGSCRIPKVRELLKKHFDGREPYNGLDPETAVACGAAILGSKIIVTQKQDELIIRDLLIKEVLPFSIGVEGKRGIMDLIARKRTTIPFNSNKIHTTHRDGQTEVILGIYNGQETLARDNHFVGDFRVANIRPAPAGLPQVLVTYSVDLNGLLDITFQELTQTIETTAFEERFQTSQTIETTAFEERFQTSQTIEPSTSEGIVEDEEEIETDYGPVLGIDFGCSNICMAVYRGYDTKVIIDDEGHRMIPSYIAFTEEDEILFGAAAESQLIYNPENTIFGLLNMIGRKFSDKRLQDEIKLWPFMVIEGDYGKPNVVVEYRGEEKYYHPEEILSLMLRHLKSLAERKLNLAIIEDVVMTIPVDFGNSERMAINNAAETAGLNIRRLVRKPTAAAVAYAFPHQDVCSAKVKILVFDLGASKLEVSIIHGQDLIFDVVATATNAFLGGVDFDKLLVHHFARVFNEKHHVDINTNKKSIRKLVRECELAKMRLSATNARSTKIEIESLYKGIDFVCDFTRSTFEDVNKDLFKRCMELVRRCLEEANSEASEIDEVILAGGSSRIPMIRMLLRDLFLGKELFDSLEPDEIMASGAAIIGANLNSEIKDNFVMEFDVENATPASLGFEMKDGRMRVVVPRDTSIPVKKKITLPQAQLPTTLQVYEGEREMVKDNLLLGQLGFPTPASGTRVLDISFHVSTNNDIQVIINDTEKLHSGIGSCATRRFTDLTKRLEKHEIAQMIRENEMRSSRQKAAQKRRDATRELKEFLDLQNATLENDRVRSRLGDIVHDVLVSANSKAVAWLENNGHRARLTEIKQMEKDQKLIFAGFEARMGL